MNNTTQNLKYYSCKQFSEALAKRGVTMTEKCVREHTRNGNIQGKRDCIRPKLWRISHSELERITNQGEG